MSKSVIIGCKLPHGIALTGPSEEEIKLNGMNTSLVVGGFGLTNVEADVAAFLFAVYEDHAAFKSNAVFTAESPKVADVVAMGRELQDERTGFEGLDPATPAPGMEAADPQQIAKAQELALKHPRPSVAPKAPADKAAANEAAGVA